MDKMKRVTVPEIGRMKSAGERITMVTAYDWTFARLLDEAGVDMLLVGDSLGMVVQGQPNTLAVSITQPSRARSDIERDGGIPASSGCTRTGSCLTSRSDQPDCRLHRPIHPNRISACERTSPNRGRG